MRHPRAELLAPKIWILALSLGLLAIWGAGHVLSPSAADGLPVAVSGTLHVATPLGDPGLLAPGDYVELWREVEIFAWHEVETARGDYRYELRFSSDPPETADFHHPAGHENPPIALRSEVRSAATASIGGYRFAPARVRFASVEDLPLTMEMLAQADRRFQLRGGKLYVTTSPTEVPSLGDLRIGYRVVRAGVQATLLGERHGVWVVPAYRARSQVVYHLFPGPAGRVPAALTGIPFPRPMLLEPATRP